MYHRSISPGAVEGGRGPGSSGGIGSGGRAWRGLEMPGTMVAMRRTVAEARVPVAVWVGPRAGEAAGTALFLLAGADVVAVAADARLGPALPAELGRGRDPAAEAALFAASGLPPAVEPAPLRGAAPQG